MRTELLEVEIDAGSRAEAEANRNSPFSAADHLNLDSTSQTVETLLDQCRICLGSR